MTKQFHSVRNHTRLKETILEHTRLAKNIQDYDQILYRKGNLFVRKYTDNMPPGMDDHVRRESPTTTKEEDEPIQAPPLDTGEVPDTPGDGGGE